MVEPGDCIVGSEGFVFVGWKRSAGIAAYEDLATQQSGFVELLVIVVRISSPLNFVGEKHRVKRNCVSFAPKLLQLRPKNFEPLPLLQSWFGCKSVAFLTPVADRSSGS